MLLSSEVLTNTFDRFCIYASTHHWLYLCAGDHGVGELHLLGQHGHVFLLDEVVPSIDLQLRL